MQPAPLTGTATTLVSYNPRQPFKMQPAPLTGTATIEILRVDEPPLLRCSPHPSRGQQRRLPEAPGTCRKDAARTPHGDSNLMIPTAAIAIMMQPAPLTGTATALRKYVFR